MSWNFRRLATIAIGVSFILAVLWLSRAPSPPSPSEEMAAFLRRRQIFDVLGTTLAEPIASLQFPNELTLALDVEPVALRVNYTLDWEAQAQVEKLLKSYKPDYAAFVSLDAVNGRILTLASYTREATGLGHLALKATFPAASIFKIITASAAIDQRRAKPDTVIGFNGGNHTLYRRNVTQNDVNRWTRYVTLSQAFAKSVNTVFAKVGLFLLEPGILREYAARFRFNENLSSDLKVEPSRFYLPDNDQWAVAEAASGFNRVATLSPLHGALIAAAIANDGMMVEPYLVDSLLGQDAQVKYRASPRTLGVTMAPDAARSMQLLMRETVRKGTSRTAFRPLFKKRGLSALEVGGKTGSLQGDTPKGKYDWFVGYAVAGGRKIAIAALTINEENWRVKSSVLARSYIEHEILKKQ